MKLIVPAWFLLGSLFFTGRHHQPIRSRCLGHFFAQEPKDISVTEPAVFLICFSPCFRFASNWFGSILWPMVQAPDSHDGCRQTNPEPDKRRRACRGEAHKGQQSPMLLTILARRGRHFPASNLLLRRISRQASWHCSNSISRG